MEMIEMRKEDVMNNKFSDSLIRDITPIINNYSQGIHSYSQKDKYVFYIFEIFSRICDVLSSIDMAVQYISEEIDKKQYTNLHVLETTYFYYHYDILIYKAASIKELVFKLINRIYQLGINEQKKNCNWENISKSLKETNGANDLFSILDKYHKEFFINIGKLRNDSIHDGVMKRDYYQDVESILFVDSYCRSYKQKNEDFLTPNLRRVTEEKIKLARIIIAAEVEKIRTNVFVFVKSIFEFMEDEYIEQMARLND